MTQNEVGEVIRRCRSCGEIVGKSTSRGEIIKSASHQCGRKCLVCKHSACPFCGDWCDVLVDDGDGDEFGGMCCDGACTYAKSSWEEEQFVLESQAVIEAAIEELPAWAPNDSGEVADKSII